MLHKKILLVDFNDSFTMNIYSECICLGLSIDVINWTQLSDYHLQFPAIIFGPGPGHPNEYTKAKSFLKKYLLKKNRFFMGICLGHQILGDLLSFKVTYSKQKLHGQSIKVKIPNWNIFRQVEVGKQVSVQRYNSLCLVDSKECIVDQNIFKCEEIKGEIMMLMGKKFISYQFHPESVGTSFPEMFFRPIYNFAYNISYERSAKNKRNLRS